jgi:hypothetical protein
MGTPPILAKAFPGRRVEPKRAGITAIAEFTVADLV